MPRNKPTSLLRFGSLILHTVILLTVSSAAEFRFDCGTESSPLSEGYQRLTVGDAYDASRGYGWLGGRAAHVEHRRPVRDPKLRGSYGQWLLEEAYDNHRNPINRDGVVSRQDIGFRLDVRLEEELAALRR
jgi:hypothetical protein